MKIFQYLLFPGIQLTRVALKYFTQGQITTANNETYKKAISRAGIFVWFRGMNILSIIYPRNKGVGVQADSLMVPWDSNHSINTHTQLLFCLASYLLYALLIYATFAQPLNCIPVSFLEGWYHASTRYHTTITSVTLVFLSNASRSIAIQDTCSHPGLSILA